MARIRSIKPEFFLHEKLFKAEKKTKLPLRVAFPGLWTVADREGRFKWKVSELKLQILPHDKVDFEKVLDALAQNGFIEKYTVDGKEYGFVSSWFDHQVIRPDEAKSRIPAPPTRIQVNPSEPVTNPSESTTIVVVEGKGKEGKGEEGNPPAQVEFIPSGEPTIPLQLDPSGRTTVTIKPYVAEETLGTKEEAFEYLKNNYVVMEDAMKTISGRGWRTVDEVDIVGLIKVFVSAKAKMDQPPNEVARHFKNWLFREPVPNLTTIATNFKKTLQ
jgi:hypothetical protein